MHLQRRPAGGQHLHRGAAGKERGDQRRDRRQQVFAVVQDEQALLRAQVGGEGFREGTIGAGRHLQGGSNRRCHQLRIGQARQVDEDGALGELRRDVVRDGQDQAGLAHPTGPGQGQQGHGFVEQERPSCGSLVVAPDEPGARDRQGR